MTFIWVNIVATPIVSAFVIVQVFPEAEIVPAQPESGAVWIDGDPMGRAKAAGRARIGPANARKEIAIRVEDAHAARPATLDGAEPEGPLTRTPPELGHVHAAARDHDLGRSLHVRDLAKVFAVPVEDLDPIALAIADEHIAVPIDRDPVRQHELARTGARLTP